MTRLFQHRHEYGTIDEGIVVRLIDFGAATIEGKQEHREDGVTINYLCASVQRSLFPSNGEILHITNLIALLILFIQAFRTFCDLCAVDVPEFKTEVITALGGVHI